MITFNDVSFGYRANKVFDGLNFQLRSGSICGLLGKNGSGKTTLMRLAAGLLAPNRGEIITLGEQPIKRTPSFLSDVFVLPEEFNLPRLSIKQYAKYYSNFYPNFSYSHLEELLDVFEVNPNKELQTMSFGQKKKSKIAFGLAANTKLMLMDEPTNGLDIPSKRQFRSAIASTVQSDRAIVISTHQIRDLDQLIDHVIILEASEILLNSSVEDITSKLIFKPLEANDEAIYQEQTVHGRVGVVLNKNNEDSPMDMELLFNAVIDNSKIIKDLFNNEK